MSLTCVGRGSVSAAASPNCFAFGLPLPRPVAGSVAAADSARVVDVPCVVVAVVMPVGVAPGEDVGWPWPSAFQKPVKCSVCGPRARKLTAPSWAPTTWESEHWLGISIWMRGVWVG